MTARPQRSGSEGEAGADREPQGEVTGVRDGGRGLFIRDRVRGPARILRGDTCNCQGRDTLADEPREGRARERPRGSAPQLRAQAASGPRARGSLLPPGSWHLGGGRGVSGGGPSEPGARIPALRSRVPARRHAPLRVPPAPEGRAEPREDGSPVGWRASRRLGSATYLGPRAAPAEPRPGRAGGRGRGARAAGARPSSPAFGAAAALGLGGGRCTIPRGRRAGAGRRDPRGLPAAGRQLRTPSRSARAAEELV